MKLVYFLFFFNIFFPLNQICYLYSFQSGKAEAILSFEKFRKLDHRNQFAYLTDLAKKKDVSYSWNYLVLAYAKNNVSKFQQDSEHSVAHWMGELIYNKKGLDGLTICTPEFGFGCYHGFSGKALNKDLSILPLIINSCKKIGLPGSGKFESCAHGIGHGVASYFLVSDLPNSLKTCETLSAGKTSCIDGVFMEFYIDAPPGFYTVKDPLYPCDAVEKKYAGACARYQPSVMEEKMHMSKNDIVASCLASSDNNLRLGCIDALAFSAAYESGGNAQYIINQCSQILGLSQFRYECLKAAAGELAFQNPRLKKTAFFICDSIPEDGRTDCYNNINNLVQKRI